MNLLASFVGLLLLALGVPIFLVFGIGGAMSAIARRCEQREFAETIASIEVGNMFAIAPHAGTAFEDDTHGRPIVALLHNVVARSDSERNPQARQEVTFPLWIVRKQRSLTDVIDLFRHRTSYIERLVCASSTFSGALT